MTGKPPDHLRRLVSAVVIQYHVNFARIGGNPLVYQLHEFQEFLMAMATVALADYLAGGDIERGKQRRRTVALVVAGPLFGQSRPQWQDRLSPVHCLHLRL